MPVDDTLPDLTSAWALIESAADRFDGTRMLVDDRDRDWTFAQYRDACSSVAARLVADGISTSSTVSWQLPTTIEAVVLLGALARLGVRQNPLIPVLRRGELEPILRQVRPDGLTECPILGYPTPQSPPELIDASAFVPAPAVDIKILDPNGEQVPDGTQGELWTKGPQSLLGYLDPDLTASLIDDAGFVSTGDLAVRSGGHVRITGRLKDVIIRNGENISAIEVETALANLPDIAEVAVVGLPDPRSGERVCAVVVPTETDRPPTLEDLATACAEAGLAKFKTPEQIRIVGGLPRSPMGKLVKASILELIQDPNTHASPQSAQEKD